MRLKAQNLIEIALLATVVVVVSITVVRMFNNQKLRLADMSRTTVKQQVVNFNQASEEKLSEPVPFTAVETAGSTSLKMLGMTQAEFESKIGNISYKSLKDAMNSNDGKDIATLANKVIKDNNLNLKELSSDSADINTLQTLVQLMNQISSGSIKTDTNTQAFIEKFSALIKESSTANKG